MSSLHESGHDYSLLTDPSVPPLRHPAARAWLGSGQPCSSPRAVESIKPRRDGTKLYKSYVFRLTAAELQGEDIIAKLTFSVAANREHLVYSQILPRLGIPSPSSYGTTTSRYPRMSWLFLEDVGRREFDQSNVEHRRQAASWLARLHAASHQADGRSKVDLPPPDHGWWLGQTREHTARALNTLGLSAVDHEVLTRILFHLDRLQQVWPTLEALFVDLPSTLVHGDLKANNLKITGSREHPTIAAVDWSQAHWGPFVIDLHFVDLESYRREATNSGFDIGGQDLARLQRISSALRTVWSIKWELSRLGQGGSPRAMRRLTSYEARLRALSPL